jgi:hypothetical protein
MASRLVKLRTSRVGNVHRIGDTRNVYNILVGIPVDESARGRRRRNGRITIKSFKK